MEDGEGAAWRVQGRGEIEGVWWVHVDGGCGG